jgi:hypothetical protein
MPGHKPAPAHAPARPPGRRPCAAAAAPSAPPPSSGPSPAAACPPLHPPPPPPGAPAPVALLRREGVQVGPLHLAARARLVVHAGLHDHLHALGLTQVPHDLAGRGKGVGGEGGWAPAGGGEGRGRRREGGVGRQAQGGWRSQPPGRRAARPLQERACRSRARRAPFCSGRALTSKNCGLSSLPSFLMTMTVRGRSRHTRSCCCVVGCANVMRPLPARAGGVGGPGVWRGLGRRPLLWRPRPCASSPRLPPCPPGLPPSAHPSRARGSSSCRRCGRGKASSWAARRRRCGRVCARAAAWAERNGRGGPSARARARTPAARGAPPPPPPPRAHRRGAPRASRRPRSRPRRACVAGGAEWAPGRDAAAPSPWQIGWRAPRGRGARQEAIGTLFHSRQRPPAARRARLLLPRGRHVHRHRLLGRHAQIASRPPFAAPWAPARRRGRAQATGRAPSRSRARGFGQHGAYMRWA